ncbi:MAG: (2Fe-2S)-binding protein [Propionibacteriaceae bacterium]
MSSIVPPLRTAAQQVTARPEAWLELAVAEQLPPGWIRVTDLIAQPALLRLRQDRAAAFLLSEYGRTDELAAAVAVLERQLQAVTMPAGALFRHHRRVPRLHPTAVAVPVDAAPAIPEITRVQLLDARFWCLPEDPDRRHPDATVVDDDTALGSRYRAEVALHAGAFLDAYAPLVRLGPHQLWGAVTDAVEHGFWFTGANDLPAVVADLAELVLPAVLPPFTTRSQFYAVARTGRDPIWTRRRATCCFVYRVAPDRLECATCPRRTDASRAALLRSY